MIVIRRESISHAPWWMVLVLVMGGIRQQMRGIRSLYSLSADDANQQRGQTACKVPLLSVPSDERTDGGVAAFPKATNSSTTAKDRSSGRSRNASTVGAPKIPRQREQVAWSTTNSSNSNRKQSSHLRNESRPTKVATIDRLGRVHPTNSSSHGHVHKPTSRGSQKQTPKNPRKVVELRNISLINNHSNALSGTTGGIVTETRNDVPTHATDIWARSRLTTERTEFEPSCYVAIENKMDYHYEVIESAILQMPLPWEKLGCNVTNGPIQFDIALAFNHRSKQGRGERQGWEQYFHEKLEGTTRHRSDGSMARIGHLVSYTNYTRDYKAIVGISCDAINFKRWLNRNARGYCVLHKRCSDCTDQQLDRTCYLTPMYNKPQCSFVPTRLPTFSNNRPSPFPTLDVCVSGGGGSRRDFGLLADALVRLQPKGVNITLYQRVDTIPQPFHQANVTHYITVNRVPGFVEFQRAVSHCHILLPLVDPTSEQGYFQDKRLTGSIPLLSAHKLPTVIHAALEEIYHDYLTAPAKIYNDSDTFTVALKEMIDSVRSAYLTSQ